MRLSHNLASLDIYRAYSKNLGSQSTALSRLTSGKKINNAVDNPNGLAKSEKINMQIRGLQAGARNSQDGISMFQTAEGGLSNINDDIQRMRELVISSGSGSLTAQDKQTIQLEINQIINDIDSIANNTEFNGVKPLNGTSGATITAVIGANPNDSIDIPMANVTNASTGLNAVDVTSNNVDFNLSLIDSAMNNVVHARSVYGGIENRFSDSINNSNEISDKMQESQSGIADADVANEMMEYSRTGILINAGIALMAQTNKMPQEILNILSQVRAR